jgi:hypothetical protein
MYIGSCFLGTGGFSGDFFYINSFNIIIALTFLIFATDFDILALSKGGGIVRATELRNSLEEDFRNLA